MGLLTQAVRKPYSIACSPRQAREGGCLDLLVGLDGPRQAGPHLTPLAPGSVMGVSGPFGRFRLPLRLRRRGVLLVAGGAGISPLRSMTWAALERLAAPEIDVVYSARTPADLVFDGDFRRLHRSGRIRYWPTVTRQVGRSWRGRRGRIDAPLLARALRPGAVCLVCGPASFVVDMTGMLRERGVHSASIRREGS